MYHVGRLLLVVTMYRGENTLLQWLDLTSETKYMYGVLYISERKLKVNQDVFGRDMITACAKVKIVWTRTAARLHHSVAGASFCNVRMRVIT